MFLKIALAVAFLVFTGFFGSYAVAEITHTWQIESDNREFIKRSESINFGTLEEYQEVEEISREKVLKITLVFLAQEAGLVLLLGILFLCSQRPGQIVDSRT